MEKNDLIGFVHMDYLIDDMLIIDQMIMGYHFEFVNYSNLVEDDIKILIDV